MIDFRHDDTAQAAPLCEFGRCREITRIHERLQAFDVTTFSAFAMCRTPMAGGSWAQVLQQKICSPIDNF
jgi:hypothetical protein